MNSYQSTQLVRAGVTFVDGIRREGKVSKTRAKAA
jgi:hypothetical protein